MVVAVVVVVEVVVVVAVVVKVLARTLLQTEGLRPQLGPPGRLQTPIRSPWKASDPN